MKNFEAIILAGGKGKRVRRYTKNIPKCLININGMPFLYHQLKYLKKNKINKVIISTGYRENKIIEYIKKIKFINHKISSDGKQQLGTGGAVQKALKYLKNNFYILYGDSYLNFDLIKMKAKTKNAIMAIYLNKNKYDNSNIELKNSKKIYYHKEGNLKKLNYIDYGVTYLHKGLFKKYKDKKIFDLKDFYVDISKNNQLKGYKSKKRFYEIGSYKGIKDLRKFLKVK